MTDFLARIFLAVLIATSIAGGSPASAGTASSPAATQTAADSDENLPPVLPSEQFLGAAAMGYAAAKNCPKVCHHLFCYCGCDITDNHKSLLDCFTGYHGVDCHICQEEAMLALRMSRNDEPLASIQRAIDEGYSNKYPFKEESPALKRYKALRKWHPQLGQATGSGGDPEGGTCCSSHN